MDFISSDTSVWIDFKVIDCVSLPFKLPYTYIMFKESMESEILSPTGFLDELVAAGLVGVNITIEGFLLADRWGNIYPKLSVPDRIALAIAKQRGIALLIGDKALRKAASQEGVSTLGTLGVLDRLLNGNYIAKDEYLACITSLKQHNGSEVRLPADELDKRLDNDK